MKTGFCLAAVFVATLIVVGCFWTGSETDFERLLSISILDDESRAVLRLLAEKEFDGNLPLQNALSHPFAVKRLAWRQLLNATSDHEVLIFDAFARPAARDAVPLVCVIVDQNGTVAAWDTIALFSEGFVTARLDRDDILTVTTHANFASVVGDYKYQLKAKSINALGEGTFRAPLLDTFEDVPSILPTQSRDEPLLLRPAFRRSSRT